MKRTTIAAAIAATLIAVVVATVLIAQPGAGAGQGRGRQAGRMLNFALYIDRTWAAVTFQLDVDDEQLLELRPVFQAAWETREQAIEQATGDPAGRALAMSNAMQQIRQDIENGLQEVLTEDQFVQWQEIQEAGLQPMMQWRGGGPWAHRAR